MFREPNMQASDQVEGKPQVEDAAVAPKQFTSATTTPQHRTRKLTNREIYRRLGPIKKISPEMPPKEPKLIPAPPARPDGHKWTEFELDTLLCLMVRNVHIYGLPGTGDSEPATPAAASGKNQKTKKPAAAPKPISKKAAHLDVATALNRALHGANLSQDIDHRDISAMIDLMAVKKKGTLATVRRMNPGGVMTKATRLILKRNIGFTGDLEEWNSGRKEEVEREYRERAEKRIEILARAMEGAADGGSAWGEVGGEPTVSGGNGEAADPWSDHPVRQSVETEDDVLWGEGTAVPKLKKRQTAVETGWGADKAAPAEFGFTGRTVNPFAAGGPLCAPKWGGDDSTSGNDKTASSKTKEPMFAKFGTGNNWGSDNTNPQPAAKPSPTPGSATRSPSIEFWCDTSVPPSFSGAATPAATKLTPLSGSGPASLPRKPPTRQRPTPMFANFPPAALAPPAATQSFPVVAAAASAVQGMHQERLAMLHRDAGEEEMGMGDADREEGGEGGEDGGGDGRGKAKGDQVDFTGCTTLDEWNGGKTYLRGRMRSTNAMPLLFNRLEARNGELDRLEARAVESLRERKRGGAVAMEGGVKMDVDGDGEMKTETHTVFMPQGGGVDENEDLGENAETVENGGGGDPMVLDDGEGLEEGEVA